MLAVGLCFDHSADSRATMELQIKTAMQMRDQGHALKQKALDLVAEAELKVSTTTFHPLKRAKKLCMARAIATG